MSHIPAVSTAGQLASVYRVGRSESPSSASAATPRAADRVELSDEARALSQLALDPPIREDLVSRVRSEIEAGTYLTDDKLDAAVNRLLGSLPSPEA
ncbi:MAG: flagellar biosynthesis anti-sigma factor FlgM [Phycisphaerae bacterium]|nr:flagellar biosynthesis anti-sigma factor FlgM [Phycisphaerae bacterium]